MQSFSLDHLTPTEFEKFCYDLLRESGFINVDWRKGTGLEASPADSGRDIECQFLQKDVDRHTYLEKWFVQCKHYKKGVPPEKIQDALAWANAKRPDKLLIIVSNFLSNPAKDYLESYILNNHPPFKIKYWELPAIEQMAAGKLSLLRKYQISGDFPSLSIMHPAHLTYLNTVPINTLDYLFGCLDKLDSEERKRVIGWVVEIIIKPRYRQPVTGKETMGSLRIDEVSYDAFKQKCYHIVSSGAIDEFILTYFIVSFSLQSFFCVADTTSVGRVIDNHKQFIDYLQKQINERPEEKEELISMINKTEKDMLDAPQRTQRNYEFYQYFCEQVIGVLLKERYLSRD